MSSPIVLVTGALGCIGSWVTYHLFQQERRVVMFDLSEDLHRLDMLLDRSQQSVITSIRGDLTDLDQVRAVLRDQGVTHIVHLAALQVPFCKADPVKGAQVNVTGTVNIFQAALEAGIGHVAYASSIAVYGPADEYPLGLVGHDARPAPRTLYGVYKVANEGTARIYWQDFGVSSVGLRPYTVYGVGRDQGLTSDPTKAMRAAVERQPFEIAFGGSMQFQLASDVALQFIDAAFEPHEGADVYNLGTAPAAVDDVIRVIQDLEPGARITRQETILPFPVGFDDSALRASAGEVYETPLPEGIRQTMEHFRRLVK